MGDHFFFVSSRLNFEEIFDHSFCVCVCQACGSATGIFVCVYSVLIVEEYEVGRAFNLTFNSQMLTWSSTSEMKSVSCLLLG